MRIWGMLLLLAAASAMDGCMQAAILAAHVHHENHPCKTHATTTRRGVIISWHHLEGTCKEGYAHGFGKAQNSFGIEYQGEFWRGRFFGRGRMTFPDGRILEGHWKGGKLQGKAVMTWPDGRIKVGVFENGRLVKLRETR